MSNQNTTFVPGVTNITAEWCQGVNDAVWVGTGQADVGLHFTETGFPVTATQVTSMLGTFSTPLDAVPFNNIQSLIATGTCDLPTFVPTLNEDKVGISSWGLRGGSSDSFMEAANFGLRIENNLSSAWVVEVDVNNEGASMNLNSGQAGIGIVMATGSTFQPDSAMWVTRVTGEGTGPGFKRGLWINGARLYGVEARAMSSAVVTTTPAAPNTLVAFCTGLDGESNLRWQVDESGILAWGTGSAAADVQMRRPSAGNLLIQNGINSNLSTMTLQLESAITADAGVPTKIAMYGLNSAAASKEFGSILSEIIDRTSTSEDSAVSIWAMIAGTSTRGLRIGNGVTVGAPTGTGFMGTGTLNVASGLYSNSTKVVGDQITGYGTPTNGLKAGSFDGATITLADLGKAVAQLILDLKTHGLLGA